MRRPAPPAIRSRRGGGRRRAHCAAAPSLSKKDRRPFPSIYPSAQCTAGQFFLQQQTRHHGAINDPSVLIAIGLSCAAGDELVAGAQPTGWCRRKRARGMQVLRACTDPAPYQYPYHVSVPVDPPVVPYLFPPHPIRLLLLLSYSIRTLPVPYPPLRRCTAYTRSLWNSRTSAPSGALPRGETSKKVSSAWRHFAPQLSPPGVISRPS